MSDFKISAKSYAKMMFHAAKYPHCAVNGILLGDASVAGSIVDAIPLFHQCLYVTPMVEIALIQIESMAADNGLQIVGYYAAAENLYDSSIDKAPATKIGDKIAENYSQAALIVIDNKSVSLTQEKAAIKIWQNIDDKWVRASFILDSADATLEAVSELLQRGAMTDIVDFDNHLDNPENDWTNSYLDRDLEQIMAMY